MPDPAPANFRLLRRRSMAGILAAAVLFTALWFVLFRLLPDPPGMEDTAARLGLALKCLAVAALFTLVAGVEAVAHERLVSPAFDPLAGHETRRLRVNQRYLRNTLEQFAIFAAALLGLAATVAGAAGMRAALASTVVWTLARWAFWIGYHRGVEWRGAGLPGMMLSMGILLYVAGRIGHEAAGLPGAAALVGGFLVLEAALVRLTRA